MLKQALFKGLMLYQSGGNIRVVLQEPGRLHLFMVLLINLQNLRVLVQMIFPPEELGLVQVV